MVSPFPFKIIVSTGVHAILLMNEAIAESPKFVPLQLMVTLVLLPVVKPQVHDPKSAVVGQTHADGSLNEEKGDPFWHVPLTYGSQVLFKNSHCSEPQEGPPANGPQSKFASEKGIRNRLMKRGKRRR